jgi:hypothetical protein
MRLDWDDLQARHHSRLLPLISFVVNGGRYETYRRICAVRTKRNQAHITVSLPAGLVVCTDDIQSSIFTCSTRVRLHRARMEAGNLAEVIF